MTDEVTSAPWMLQMVQRTLDLLPAASPWMLGGAALLALLVWRTSSPRWTWFVGAAAAVVGLIRAHQRPSLFDDAYISMRYAQNLLDGHGLVWNVGERVEGYTNFLWTLILAAGSGVTGVELPLVALVASLAAFVACVLLLTVLAETGRPPIAALLFSLHVASVDYATTGMETLFNAALVLGGLLVLTRQKPAWIAGLLLACAVLTRPDAALFWLAGAATVAVTRPRRELLAYAAPVLLVVVHLMWRLHYYGDWVPNTFHAKVGGAYWTQGLRYTLAFFLASQGLVIVPFALAAFWRRRVRADPLLVFAAIALPLHHLYVARVGGDFMVHRFLLVVLPVWLLLAERGLSRLREPLEMRLVLAAVLGLSAGSVQIIGPESHRWRISDEVRFYPVVGWHPVVVDNANYAVGKELGRVFDGELRPPVATSGIGMVGYYSGLPVIDILGLTDRRTARQEHEKKRGMAGHERLASQTYVVEERGVRLGRWYGMYSERHARVIALELGPQLRHSWHLFRHDPVLAAHLRARGVAVLDPGRLIDRWLIEVHQRRPTLAVAEEDARFFDRYYFSAVDDPVRRERVAAMIEHLRAEDLEPAGSSR